MEEELQYRREMFEKKVRKETERRLSTTPKFKEGDKVKYLNPRINNMFRIEWGVVWSSKVVQRDWLTARWNDEPRIGITYTIQCTING